MHLLVQAAAADLIVCAWGNHGGHRADYVREMLAENGLVLHCLGVNKTGEPVHPLYQRKNLKPIPLPEEEDDD